MEIEENLFVPICLYSKSFYYIKDNIEYLFKEIITQYDKSVLIIADDLRAYNLIIKKEESSIDIAYNKARNRGSEIRNMILKVLEKVDENDNIKIHFWKEISGLEKYIQLKNKIETLIQSDSNISCEIDRFIEYNLSKIAKENNSLITAYEYRYILEEITMSIYMTEVENYTTELWEKRLNLDEPDPIQFIYENYSRDLMDILDSNKLKRKLITLEEKTTHNNKYK